MKNKNFEKSNNKYYNLDLARYLSSVLIVILHLGPFVETSDFASFLLNNTIVRVCVPLFFMITGYFVFKKEQEDANYIYKYIKSLIPIYLFWSLIYIPQGLVYINEMGVAPILYPVTLIVALFNVGTYYHLWYFPALMLALLALKALKKHLSIKKLLSLSFILLVIGSFETYYGILPDFIQGAMDSYLSIFFTTRNFLFFGLFYVTLGYHLASADSSKIKKRLTKTLIFLLLFIFEVYIIKGIKRMDSNILIMAAPLSYYSLATILNSQRIPFWEFKHPLRQLYTYYYLVHPLVFLFLNKLIPEVFVLGANTYKVSFIKIIIALIMVHMASVLILEIKKRYKKLPI